MSGEPVRLAEARGQDPLRFSGPVGTVDVDLDEDGVWQARLPPGVWDVHLYTEEVVRGRQVVGPLVAAQGVEVVEAGVLDLDVELVGLSGRVRWDGEPVGRDTVVARVGDRELDLDEDGAFEVWVARDAPVRVSVELRDPSAVSRPLRGAIHLPPLRVAEDTVRDLVVGVATVRGRAEVIGRPAPWSLHVEAAGQSTVVAETGRYALHVPVGPVDLELVVRSRDGLHAAGRTLQERVVKRDVDDVELVAEGGIAAFVGGLPRTSTRTWVDLFRDDAWARGPVPEPGAMVWAFSGQYDLRAGPDGWRHPWFQRDDLTMPRRNPFELEDERVALTLGLTLDGQPITPPPDGSEPGRVYALDRRGRDIAPVDGLAFEAGLPPGEAVVRISPGTYDLVLEPRLEGQGALRPVLARGRLLAGGTARLDLDVPYRDLQTRVTVDGQPVPVTGGLVFRLHEATRRQEQGGGEAQGFFSVVPLGGSRVPAGGLYTVELVTPLDGDLATVRLDDCFLVR